MDNRALLLEEDVEEEVEAAEDRGLSSSPLLLTTTAASGNMDMRRSSCSHGEDTSSVNYDGSDNI